MNRDRKGLTLVLLLGVGLLAGCTTGNRSLPAENPARVSSPNNRAPFKVRVLNVQPSPTSSGERLIPAALSVDSTAIVLAERAGRITNLTVSEGTRVNKGTVIARFDDEAQRTQLREAEIDVSRLKVEEQQYEALLKLRRSELERERRLEKDGVTSKVNVEQAEYRLEQAIHEYEKAKLASANSLVKLKAAEIEIAKSTVRAPITGVIIRRYATLGSTVAQDDKLFEISKLSPLELKFQLPQNENRKLNAGEMLDLFAVDSDRVLARARIRRVNPVADATSNTVGYVADVIGSAGLMPGLAVNVRLPPAGNAVSFWIPRVVFPSGTDLRSITSATLFIVNGARAGARLVVINSIEGDQVEVVSGLNANDSVIVSPPSDLKDQDPIEIS